uniref:Uncharacterized LOC101170068 n=1 Tax=Oryzias latipes TaxID=8090 RepID=A0A3P9KZA9_ORYLA
MGHLFGLGWLLILIGMVDVEAQNPPLNIGKKCLGNVMRIDVGPLGGKNLEVAAVMNNTAVILTSSLASQCGFSMKRDQLGNAMIFASLQNCFAQNLADEMFTTTLHLRVSGPFLLKDEIYQVVETCQYSTWASREVICDNNYMEVSLKRAVPEDYHHPKRTMPLTGSKPANARRSAEKVPMDAGFRITTVVFFTPEGEKVMTVNDAHKKGYWVGNSPTRLVQRVPSAAPEIFTHNVAGVPMRVFKTSTIFEKTWLATQIDAAAACPLQEGSVFFTRSTITWYLPRHIDPMITSQQFTLLEVHFGINGQRMDAGEMQANKYSLALTDHYIVTEIPIGAAGGYFKSHVQANLYYISYMIEPMLEMLWSEDSVLELTKYKVYFTIATNVLPHPPQLVDNTVPAERMFKMALGHFALDVVLLNITFGSEVLSVTDCMARGFNIMEHLSHNDTMRVYSLQVPFTDPAVSKLAGEGVIVYSLHLTFGLLVLDTLAPFSHAAYLEAVLEDMIPPSVSGGCDQRNFFILVKYGTKGFNFQTTVGKRLMTPSLAQHYNYMENGTHFSFVVPFLSSDAVVEAIESSSIRSRLNVILVNPQTNEHLKDFSMACNFPSTLTECFPNGTMTALAVKLESVPSLDPSGLTLRDHSCGPVYSDERYAYFVFTVNSCGTTRKFLPDGMLYENEIALPDDHQMKPATDSEEAHYDLKVTCLYDINTSHAVAFHTRPRRSEPYAENSEGQLHVVMRLSLDDSYSNFQMLEDFPIAKYLQQPLYFEVELKRSTNPQVSLELENCWATQEDDKTSQPRWNLIINGCPNPVDPYQVMFHPVWADERVRYPPHFKRFEVQMFAFADEKDDLVGQLFVHCDIVICDAKNPLGGVCSRQCPNPDAGMRGQKRDIVDVADFEHVSLGPIAFLQ